MYELDVLSIFIVLAVALSLTGFLASDDLKFLLNRRQETLRKYVNFYLVNIEFSVR